MPSISVDSIARMYRIPIIDYARDARGVLVSSGCGIMMAIMDEARTLRWCVDIDELPRENRLHDFMLWLPRLARPIAVAGFFSLTDPTPLRMSVAALSDAITYGGAGVSLGGSECSTLRDFLDKVNAHA